MTYENAFLFGKNASIINEAYSKMYSSPAKRGNGKNRTINEASGDEPSDEELRKSDLGLSDEQRDYIRNFDAEKEYKDIIAAEKRGRTDDDDEEIDDEEVVDTQASAASQEDDDDEDTQNFMSSFNSKRDRDIGRGGDDDFIFSYSRYDDQLRKRYPDWLVKAAEAAGHKLPIRGEEPMTYGGHGAKVRPMAQNPMDAEISNEESGDEGTPWDNLWENIIVANPDVFNEERYDMVELPKHKKEFRDKWEQYFLKGVDEIDAAERALEEIPGCECKVKDDEMDFVGNLDDEEVDGEEEFEEPEQYKSPWDREGFGIVVKSYERDFSPGGRNMKFMARYITPPQFKGTVFETKEEAIDALREYMTELIGDPSDVCVGVVLDHAITNKIFNGDGYDVMRDADGNVVTYTSGPMAGKPKKVKLDSTVYTISSSDKENTDRSISYETSDWRNAHDCDEYLQ